MRVLVTGPESSGTRMVTGLLGNLGVDVTHSSPMYRLRQQKWDYQLPTPGDFDAVVVVVRHGPWRDRSAVDNGHHANLADARAWAALGLRALLMVYPPERTYVVTYEALLYERDAALAALCEDLGLDVPASTMRAAVEEIGDANAKYRGGAYFRDDRMPWERGQPPIPSSGG